MTHRSTIAIALAFACLLTSACRDQSPPAEASSAGEASSWLLTSAPAGAQGVLEAKAAALEGEPIVLRGRIGGRLHPISEESPVFTLVDLSLPHCGENPEDGCPTPWDYCCEPPETIAAHAATVQIVDGNGRPLTNLADGALEPLDEVVVVGAVANRSNDGLLTVRATGIYRPEG